MRWNSNNPEAASQKNALQLEQEKVAFAAFSISEHCHLFTVFTAVKVIPLLTNKEKTV
ncbi:hypothetical protein FSI32_007715 [Escherichia coli]|nr:hypothetical protein [Escherichia coli]